MELESIGVSEVSPTQKAKAQVCELERRKDHKGGGSLMKTEGRLIEPRKGSRGGRRRRKGELLGKDTG